VWDYITVYPIGAIWEGHHPSRFTTAVLLFAWENHIAAVSFRAT
jgi:hypothetical protein